MVLEYVGTRVHRCTIVRFDHPPPPTPCTRVRFPNPVDSRTYVFGFPGQSTVPVLEYPNLVLNEAFLALFLELAHLVRFDPPFGPGTFPWTWYVFHTRGPGTELEYILCRA